MSFGKDSSFVFIMQDGKLINIGRSDNTADKQPFDDVEKEVWRIFGEWKQFQSENEMLRFLCKQALQTYQDYNTDTQTTIVTLYEAMRQIQFFLGKETKE